MCVRGESIESGSGCFDVGAAGSELLLVPRVNRLAGWRAGVGQTCPQRPMLAAPSILLPPFSPEANTQCSSLECSQRGRYRDRHRGRVVRAERTLSGGERWAALLLPGSIWHDASVWVDSMQLCYLDAACHPQTDPGTTSRGGPPVPAMID
jgi:hypothetical protein